MHERQTHIDLFSGIGGFALAAQRAGFRTVAFVEKEPFCQKVLAKHWPDVPCYSDIFQFGGKPYRGADLLTGGFPCQPFSQAGKRRGKEDDRYLWPEMLRVIQTTKSRWILGENVDGLDGMGLCQCISDLERLEYEVGPPLEIPACAVNAPHERNRIWIIANRNGRLGEDRLPQKPVGRRKPRPSEAEEMRVDTYSNSLRKLQPEGIVSDQRRWPVHVYQEFDIGESWADRLTKICGMDNGLSRRVEETKPYGNAIVPQVAYQIIKEIRKLI